MVEVLAGKIAQLHPEFTDHSVKHFDALWSVTDQVLTEEEGKLVTPSEAFVLGSSFYIHDLGMAIGATTEGISELKKTESYIATVTRNIRLGMPKEQAEAMAIRLAARAEHAKIACTLVSCL